jgi:uncharacterized protein YjdB
MRFFDGTNWSDKINISEKDDNLSASAVEVTQIEDNKTFIIYKEQLDNNSTYALKYRIYNETTHALSDIQIIPQTASVCTALYNPFTYCTANKNDGNAIIAIYKEGYQVNDFYFDTIRCINYDIVNDEFTVLPHRFINKKEMNNCPKQHMITCDSNGNCIIVFHDGFLHTINTVTYDNTTGFGEPQLVENNNNHLFSAEKKNIRAEFDSDDNLNIIWSDWRDTPPPPAWVVLNLYYQKGTIQTIPVSSIIVTGENQETTITTLGGTLQMLAEVLPENASNNTVTWSISSGEEYGEINQSGLLTAIGNGTITIRATAIDGSEIFGEIDIEILNQTSINNYIKNGISIHPNPSTGIFTIDFKSSEKLLNVLITDITGKTILNSKFQNSTLEGAINSKIDLSKQPKGIYFINIQTEKGNYIEKLIIQ